jgi:hypothetical protein
MEGKRNGCVGSSRSHFHSAHAKDDVGHDARTTHVVLNSIVTFSREQHDKKTSSLTPETLIVKKLHSSLRYERKDIRVNLKQHH